jgi:hypothetical protein
MTGTSTDVGSYGTVSGLFDTNFFVQLDISGSLAAHDLQLLSAFVIGSHYILDTSPLVGQGGPDFCSLSDCIDLTTKNGRITGATVAIGSGGGSVSANIGPAGDSFVYSFYDPGDMCGNNRASGECILSTANMTPGTWTVATSSVPEIDPTSAASGLLLLFGSLAVVRSRRNRDQTSRSA